MIDQYSAAVANLDSSHLQTQFDGVDTLSALMEEYPREQPAVVRALCDFLVTQASNKNPLYTAYPPPRDIQDALTAITTRDPADDGSTTAISLIRAYLVSTELQPWANLDNADLVGANLGDVSGAHAQFAYANLADTDISKADLTDANFSGADLTDANFSGADLTDANFSGADLAGAKFMGANCKGAKGLPPRACGALR